MHGPREVLNELKWREGFDLAAAEVWYVHRGAPNDTRIITGDNIEELGPSFMQIASRDASASIPYHRVYRISYRGEPIWERRGTQVSEP